MQGRGFNNTGQGSLLYWALLVLPLIVRLMVTVLSSSWDALSLLLLCIYVVAYRNLSDFIMFQGLHVWMLKYGCRGIFWYPLQTRICFEGILVVVTDSHMYVGQDILFQFVSLLLLFWTCNFVSSCNEKIIYFTS
jgi:hypothetical protein